MRLNELRKKIEKSPNPELTKENFNFLLANKKLTPETISQVLAITEGVNDRRNAIAGHYRSHYGFDGGKLTKESLNKILKRKYKDDMLAIMMFAAFDI